MNAAATFCARAVAYLKTPADESSPTVRLSQPDSPVLRDLKNGLLVAYLVDEGNGFTYVQHRHVSDAGLTLDELHEAGVSNLHKIADDRIRVQEYGSVFAVFLDGNFEASLILVDWLWSQALAHLVKSGFVAAIPARDVLAFCDAESTQGLSELRQIVGRLEKGDHLLTPVLYRRAQGQWSRYAA
jgi:uncharacterized protein YtpQ (UPF0354 family)